MSTIVGTMVLTVWLILSYGSWELADPLVRATNLLTISYVRYWLPIVIVLAPWAAAGAEWMVSRVDVRARLAAMTLVLVGIASVTTVQTIGNPLEGILRQRAAIDEHRVRARAIIQATESDAVIVSDRMDKVFFPERAVIHASEVSREDQQFLTHLSTLLDHAPVYWYAPGEVRVPGFTLTPVAGAPFGERLARVSR